MKWAMVKTLKRFIYFFPLTFSLLDVVFESSSRLNKRTLRKRNNDQLETKSNKKKQTTGPVFNIKLKDEEIVSDLEAMKSSIK